MVERLIVDVVVERIHILLSFVCDRDFGPPPERHVEVGNALVSDGSRGPKYPLIIPIDMSPRREYENTTGGFPRLFESCHTKLAQPRNPVPTL